MKEQILQEAKKLGLEILDFLKNPIHGIRQIPTWTWREVLLCQAAISAATGVLTGLVSRSFVQMFLALFLSPIITAAIAGISTLFLYYAFQVISGRTLSFRQLYTLLFFSNIPFFIFQIVSDLIPPITLIGLAFTGLLLIVGLVENFQLPKKHVLYLVAAIYLAFFIIWTSNRVKSYLSEDSTSSHRAPPVYLEQ